MYDEPSNENYYHILYRIFSRGCDQVYKDWKWEDKLILSLFFKNKGGYFFLFLGPVVGSNPTGNSPIRKTNLAKLLNLYLAKPNQ